MPDFGTFANLAVRDKSHSLEPHRITNAYRPAKCAVANPARVKISGYLHAVPILRTAVLPFEYLPLVVGQPSVFTVYHNHFLKATPVDDAHPVANVSNLSRFDNPLRVSAFTLYGRFVENIGKNFDICIDFESIPY